MRWVVLAKLVLAVGLTPLSPDRAAAATDGEFADPSGTVSFLNVRDEHGLFGSAHASADSLDFSPRDFEARCASCPDQGVSRDSLTLDIQARGDRRIGYVEVREALDYTLQSFDPDGFAAVQAFVTIRIAITEIDGRAVDLPSKAYFVEFQPSSVASVLGSGMARGVLVGSTGLVDLRALVDESGEIGLATRVRMQLGTVLFAFAEGDGSVARLEVGDADWTAWTMGPYQPVPEPSTSLLMMLGLAALSRRPRWDR